MPRTTHIALFLAAALAVPAAGQFQSDGYKFLQAVKDAKGNDVIAALNRPGNTLVNTRDSSNGETALHIVVRRGDSLYTRFMLEKGADPNARDAKGATPLIDAALGGYDDLIPILTAAKANPNLANASGETPLIVAVHRRDADMVRLLLAAGADPDQTDTLAGKSARDYATLDTRNPAISKQFTEAPRKIKRSVAGPRL